MIAVAILLFVLAVSLLIVRIGTIALMMTGLSEGVAQFQALSAFSRAGFTTTEAESITKHPTRRRIVVALIRLGSAGIVTAISTLVISFASAGAAAPERLVVLFVGTAIIIGLARSQTFNRLLTPLIKRVLSRSATLELRDYASLLHIHEDYSIVEIDVEPDSWLARSELGELDLPVEGVRVLGVVRSEGDYVGAPPPDLCLKPGDRLIVYGREHRLSELSTRRSEDEAAHAEAREEHAREMESQSEKLEE
jgi:hypothetical protein